MSSLWKHPNSKYWTACYTDHTGKQVKRSTKKTNRDEAMTIALEYERAEKSARDGLLPEAQCRKVLSEILEKTTGDHIRHLSVEAFFREWLSSKELAKSAGTAARYRHTAEIFLEKLKHRVKRPLSSVMTRDVQGFLDARLKAGCSTKTVSVDAKTLNNAFNRARRQGLIQSNPVEAVELPDVESSEREVFSPAQVNCLLATSKGEWLTTIFLGYYIGARLGDCVRMKWDNVHFAKGIIDYEPEKTHKRNRRVVVPLHPDLEAHLQKLAGSDKPQTYLCPSLAEKKSGGAHGLSQTFKKLMKDAGIDSQTGKGKGNRQFSKVSFHSLRHSFNSALANAGVNQELRMKLTGHTTLAVNAKYTHHELAPLKAAILKLPSLGQIE
jgi:integrase